MRLVGSSVQFGVDEELVKRGPFVADAFLASVVCELGDGDEEALTCCGWFQFLAFLV